MKLLLDTHVFIWAALSPERFTVTVRDLIQDRDNTLLLSAVSAYEIEFKRERDPALRDFPSDLIAGAAEHGFEWLPLTPRQATIAGRLPRLHGDPFDRLLIGQAQDQNVPMVTTDHQISRYGIRTIW